MKKLDKEKPVSPNYGFPSHEVPADKKNKEWHLQYMKAFYKEYTQGEAAILRWAYDEYTKWRLYGRGRQPIDQYKEQLSVQKRKGKKDMSWRNIDWSILPIMPRFKRVIKNKLLKQPREIMLSAIDQTSATEERSRANSIVEFLANRENLLKAEGELGEKFNSPFEKGEPIPENQSEIPLYQAMYPKNRALLEFQDQIDLALLISDWDEIEKKLIDDFIDCGIGAVRVYIDNLGRIRLKRRVPEQTVTNACIENDFSDLIRIGEFRQVTISELRASVPAGTFTEKDLMDIANQANNKQYTLQGYDGYFATHNRYPWDHERVTEFSASWFSADDTAWVDDHTTKSLTKKDDAKWLDKKGISDKDYEKFYKKKKSPRSILRSTVNNVYTACWIVDTKHVYNYGMQNDMIRSVSSLFDCELDTAIQTLDFDSPMREAEPVLDNIQLNWLQYQHHIASSKPDGVAIEKRALQSVEIGSEKLTVKDLLQMYAESGNYVYTGTDAQGRPYPFKPLEAIKGGISEAADRHLSYIIQNIDLLRVILGLNEATDSVSVDPRLGKKVAELQESNSNNALASIYDGFLSVYKRAVRKVCLLVPEAEDQAQLPGKVEALGEETRQYFQVNRSKHLMDIAVKVDAGADGELRQILSNHLNASLKVNGGPLLPEDVFLIENEKNLRRAYLLLAQKRRQRMEEEEQSQIRLMQAQAQSNTETAVALEKEKQATAELDAKMYGLKKQADTESQIAIIREQAKVDLVLKKLEKGFDLDETEKKIVADLVKTEMKAANDLEKARISKAAKPPQKKSA